MTVTLNLNPEVEKGLIALAEARGLSLSEYLQEIVVREAAAFHLCLPSAVRRKPGPFWNGPKAFLTRLLFPMTP